MTATAPLSHGTVAVAVALVDLAPVASCLSALEGSATERRHNEQPGTDQHGKGNAADDRENAMPAIGGAGPGKFCAATIPIQKSLISALPHCKFAFTRLLERAQIELQDTPSSRPRRTEWLLFLPFGYRASPKLLIGPSRR
jgi:hypothetical protein